MDKGIHVVDSKADSAMNEKGKNAGSATGTFGIKHDAPSTHLQQPKLLVGRWAIFSLSPTAGTSIQRPGLISQMSHWRRRWCQSSVHPWHLWCVMLKERLNGRDTITT